MQRISCRVWAYSFQLPLETERPTQKLFYVGKTNVLNEIYTPVLPTKSIFIIYTIDHIYVKTHSHFCVGLYFGTIAIRAILWPR
jgi:hypothetical protein